MKKILIFFLLSTGMVMAQTPNKHTTAATKMTLVWCSDVDTSAKYLVYFREISGTDTTWKLIGYTKQKLSVIIRGTKKNTAFGIRTIYGSDTSDMASSLDTTACNSLGASCDSCSQIAPWYMNWGANMIKRLRDSGQR
jgi:hypothetical protein